MNMLHRGFLSLQLAGWAGALFFSLSDSLNINMIYYSLGCVIIGILGIIIVPSKED